MIMVIILKINDKLDIFFKVSFLSKYPLGSFQIKTKCTSKAVLFPLKTFLTLVVEFVMSTYY